MQKRVVSIIICVAAWSYLLYKLFTYEDYALLWNKIITLPSINYIFLVIILFLMPLNWWFEVEKWHVSVNRLKTQSFYDSFMQVLLGNAGAFITPYRLGEHPSRAYYLDDKNLFFPAVVLGFIGTIALEIINVGLGLPASVFYFSDPATTTLMIVYGVVLFVVIILFLLLPQAGHLLARHKKNNQQVRQVIDMLDSLSINFLLRLILLSILRYAVYCFQLYMALRLFGIDLGLLTVLIAIPTYYMLVSISPSLPIADAAIRGSWAIVVFQAYTYDTPAIAFAVVILWLINTALPLLAVPFVKKK